MLIENIMYFALGLLLAGLIALVIMPAVWQRAVRLTKRRIEAATPITMAEFRADKDQLRAEFAISTRRLEQNVETLRKRLAEQLSDANLKKADLGGLNAERERHAEIVSDLESREAELRKRVQELEKESTDLAQRLRMRERDLDTRNAELEALRANLHAAPGEAQDLQTAEAQMASAGSSLNALLESTGTTDKSTDQQPGQLLADQLSLEDDLAALRAKVDNVERSILADWETVQFDATKLRAKLSNIATSVSGLVYREDRETVPASFPEESLFDRVQRFADDGESHDLLPLPVDGKSGAVSDRLAAVKEIQGR